MTDRQIALAWIAQALRGITASDEDLTQLSKTRLTEPRRQRIREFIKERLEKLAKQTDAGQRRTIKPD